jgi:flagellar basal body-associated protein FliL
MPYCSNCGKEIIGESSYCGNCGKQITTSQTDNQFSSSSSPNDVKSELRKEAQRDVTSFLSREKKHVSTKVIYVIIGAIIIALTILVLFLFKSNVFNKSVETQNQEAAQETSSAVNTDEPSQTEIQNSDTENADKMESSELKVFLRYGTVAGGRPFIETDKNIYNYGEKISVYFYNAPGNARDWICIVPAGSRNTTAGDYQYIPSKERGVMTFKSPKPGRYEARAYYSYSHFRYTISARYHFTVLKRPANY